MESSDAPSDLIPPSLRTLLAHIVDYAGLFPPADLSLRRAFQNYAEYREQEEAWMLSRFVLPVRRLPDLAAFRQQMSADDAPYVFSVLGTGGGTTESFLEAFARDLDVIEAFDEEQGGSVRVDVMEVPLPASLVGAERAEVESFLDAVNRRLVTTGTAKLDLFFELPMQADATDQLPSLCATLADHNSQQSYPARSTAGLKVRCGGGDPSDVPAPDSVAALLVACRDASVSCKATAGLHHPIRHYDDGLDTEMHGFLNIFVAAALAAEHTLGADDVEAILREDTADNVRFLKDAVAWRDLSVSLDGVRHARETLALSFGSCSFDEPIDHLRDLELL